MIAACQHFIYPLSAANQRTDDFVHQTLVRCAQIAENAMKSLKKNLTEFKPHDFNELMCTFVRTHISST